MAGYTTGFGLFPLVRFPSIGDNFSSEVAQGMPAANHEMPSTFSSP